MANHMIGLALEDVDRLFSAEDKNVVRESLRARHSVSYGYDSKATVEENENGHVKA